MRSRLLRVVVVAALTGGCSHVRPDSETVAQHRNEAAIHEARANQEYARFEAGEAELRRPAGAPPLDQQGMPDDLSPYNPTQQHLAKADEEMASRNEELAAAHALEKFENEACEGLSSAQRSACPLLASSVSRVENTADGFRLVMKPTVDVAQTFRQLDCHLAYANAMGFNAPSCPLFIRGTKLSHDAKSIEFKGETSTVGHQLRAEARRIFLGSELSADAPQ